MICPPETAQLGAENNLNSARWLAATEPEPGPVSDASYIVGYVVTLMVEVSILVCVLFVVYRLMSNKRRKRSHHHAKK